MIKVTKNTILKLIENIWFKLYEYDTKDANYIKLIDAILTLKDNLIEHTVYYNFGYLHTLLQCIKYSINPKSSMHYKLPSYIQELDRMDKKTFNNWLKTFQK